MQLEEIFGGGRVTGVANLEDEHTEYCIHVDKDIIYINHSGMIIDYSHDYGDLSDLERELDSHRRHRQSLEATQEQHRWESQHIRIRQQQFEQENAQHPPSYHRIARVVGRAWQNIYGILSRQKLMKAKIQERIEDHEDIQDYYEACAVIVDHGRQLLKEKTKPETDEQAAALKEEMKNIAAIYRTLAEYQDNHLAYWRSQLYFFYPNEQPKDE